ncbi:MAG: acyl-CoA dehydrogenase family protein [Hyphomonadaceae bacterium]
MRLSFSSDHEDLRAEFARVFAAEADLARARAAASQAPYWDRGLWKQLADLGWLGVATPEAHGGLGQSPLSLCLIAETIGAHPAAIPFASSVLGFAPALTGSANSLLSGAAQGEIVGALIPLGAWHDLTHKGQKLSGHIAAAPDGHALTHAMTLVGGEALMLIDLRGAARDRVDSLDRVNIAASITCDAAPCETLARGADAARIWRRALAHYAVFLAFLQIGGADAALRLASAHVRQRYAFGRALGSFQAVKHSLADVLAAIEIGRSNAYYAAAALDEPDGELTAAAAAARVSATAAHRLAARTYVHLLGALGATYESDAHLHYRRAQAWGACIGAPEVWREEFLRYALAQRSEAA